MNAPAPDRLTELWSRPPGVVGWLGQTNHKVVGRRFLTTAFLLFLVGGLLAVVMRTQLAVPDNDVVGAQTYNGLFTMHGTIMMFLFVVPMLEGFMVYVGPLIVGARDMPMPRLTAFGYWTFLAGALVLLSSFLVGAVPDGGWFAYTPLTGDEFSPGANLDIWLIGVTMLEVSGITAAIEVIVLVCRCRAPGMTISRIPLFSWAALVAAVMIVFAFPPLVAASVLLELDRKLDTVFYVVEAGGDPLLWQHLFWFFGHPEVYIQLIPALGIVLTVVPVAARRPIAVRSWVAAALVSIGILSFGLWVHHMYAVGIPLLSTSFFTAASATIAIPSGVVVMAVLATLWWGRLVWSTALRFCVGFVAVFVLGGITGVMVALVPFDWQAHDSYFVVAHFHYVLIGGSVFPILAGLYHWWPKLVGRTLDETWGRWAFWTVFVGFNTTFLPQHVLGLWGMPRRVWTYQEGLGWDTLNLVSTLGSYLLGIGILLFLVDAVRSLRRPADAPADPWGAATLDFSVASPPPPYNFRRFPSVRGAEPLWVPAGERAPAAVDPAWTARSDDLTAPARPVREGLVTSVLDAAPQHVVDLAGPSTLPLVAALTLTGALVGALIDAPALAVAGVLGLVVSVVAWLWPSAGPIDLRTPARTAHAIDGPPGGAIGWWGLCLLLAVLGVFLASLVGAAVYLRWGAAWPPEGVPLPALLRPLLVPAAAVVGVAGAVWARRGVVADRQLPATIGLLLAVLAGSAALWARWVVHAAAEVPAGEHAYGSVAAVLGGFEALVVATATVAAVVVSSLDLRGLVGRGRHLEVDVVAGLWGFAAVTSAVVYATAQLLPRL